MEWVPVLHISINHCMQALFDLTLCVFVLQWTKNKSQMWRGCCSLLVLPAASSHPSGVVNHLFHWRYTAGQPVWRLAWWDIYFHLLKNENNTHTENRLYSLKKYFCFEFSFSITHCNNSKHRSLNGWWQISRIHVQYPVSCISVVYSFQIMNLERQLSAMLRLGNYPKNNLKMSFFCKLLFWFLLKKYFWCHFRNNLLWLHTVFAVVYLILTVILLRRHTSQMKGIPRETVSCCLRRHFDHSASSL